MKSFPAAIFALAALALILSAAGCAELPQGAEGEGFFGPPADSTVQTTATPAYLTEVTPMATATPTAQPTFPKRPDSGTAANPYVEILNETLVFNYNATAWTYDLVKAPMIIDLHVNPVLIKDVKAGDSSYGNKDEYTITKMVPSPLAEFEIRVINLSDGTVIAEEGYGSGYTYTEDQLIRLYYPGKYQIEMRGSFVSVDTVITVPQENI